MNSSTLDPSASFIFVKSSSSSDDFCLVDCLLTSDDISYFLQEWRNVDYDKNFPKIDWVFDALAKGVVLESYFLHDVNPLISLALEKKQFAALIGIIKHEGFVKNSNLRRLEILCDALEAKASEEVIAAILQKIEVFGWHGVKGIGTREKLSEKLNIYNPLVDGIFGYSIKMQATFIAKMAKEAGISPLEIGFARKYPAQNLLVTLVDQGADLKVMEGNCYFDLAIGEKFYLLAERILIAGFSIRDSKIETQHGGVLQQLCLSRGKFHFAWDTSPIDSLIVKIICLTDLDYFQEKDVGEGLLDKAIEHRWENIALALIDKISNNFPRHKLNHILFKLIDKRMNLSAIAFLEYYSDNNPRVHDLIHTLHDAIKQGMKEYCLTVLRMLNINNATSFMGVMMWVFESMEFANAAQSEEYLFKCLRTAMDKCHATLCRILLSEVKVPLLTAEGAEIYQELRLQDDVESEPEDLYRF